MQANLDEKANTSFGRSADDPGAVMRWDDAERFLEAYQANGRAPATLQKYRQTMEQFYGMLPQDKRFYRSTLAQWRDELLANGYSNASENVFLASGASCLFFSWSVRQNQVAERMCKEWELKPN